MFKRLISAALVFGAASIAPPAAAQDQSQQCYPRAALVEKLQGTYGEALTGGGLQSPNRLIEVWSSKTTGSFTVIITQANGMSCVVATGKNWNTATFKIPEGVAG
ncbi:MAG: hypothetical protein AAGF53_05655 [Pseudomonadota bacterium]